MEWFWDELIKNHQGIAVMELSLPSFKILKSDPMIVIIFRPFRIWERFSHQCPAQ